MTDKIEGSPSQQKRSGVTRTEAIFSLRSIRSKMPLGMCGADGRPESRAKGVE
jgi:hypothetical protein